VDEMKKYLVILFLLILAIFISGCINVLPTPGEDSITQGEGRLKIYLTDSSEKYKVNDSETYSEVNITISRIEAHTAGDDGEDEGEWIELELNGETIFDLIELKNEGLSVLLSEVELEPGKYTQLRLFLKGGEDDAWLVLNDEDLTEVPLVIPSAYQTGIKLIHPFEIIEGETIKLTIDFDAEKSMVKTGNESYKLKPVIKIVTVSTGEDGE
jgi:predicted small secreted protein